MSNNKVDRLANNIQIMLKSKTSRSLCINRKNEKAFQLAVKQLGMKLDEFDIEDDCFYLEIRLKRHILKRPELPKNSTTHPSLKKP
ncbi:MAG: hypothetical protein GPJ29_10975 [Microcystis aeruginosa BK11-02]|nr:hypothetical protein [Microcystis aeruginosa BK11-02]NCS76346.1 hypothetical protein [Microcystis aeruginosa K13-07]